ncbi:Lutropin-choriogonadotropic hormone receptor [Penaeus vannamei]|uniref:Lutropin-choriogonadotropic hormone receptor n=1 Tax=Penaeus vannamei TaxID=6689 RepID=A0A3R7QSX5_PENVA|nr:Lutropin-choriogonadotropic hormone receptor [Penaeus vannamei]
MPVAGGQDPRPRSRRRDSARMHPLLDRSSESGIHSLGSRFLVEADKTRVRDGGPKDSAPDEIIPSPDKRFGKEEFPDNADDVADRGSFVGRIPVAGNGYPSSFLGFGSFNYSSDRYPTDASKSNESVPSGRWGGHQGWARGPPPPLDSGDDNTYGLYIPHDGGHALGFPEATDGEGFHEATGGGFRLFDETEDEPLVPLQHDNSWHPIQAPLNNTTIIVLCGNISKNYHDVLCIPAPDAFNPCEDIMGNLALRVAVWFVVVTAVVGNLAVMLVLVSSKFRTSTLRKLEQKLDVSRSRCVPSYGSSPSSRMTVSKFLMVNLAIADLCMGVYLLIIAAMDLHTIGVYFNYAIDWQNGPGCKVAGFLTVFASELSIFTLTVITSERWYAITYAIHLNKRLKLSMAAKIMVLGWIYSISMATLPLVGISGYSKTSICLPMETGDALALAYLISLLLVNGLAFFVITACYASMYCSISRHDATATHSDLTVAKRMALLVFTDFACWAPIAFFGLTAVAGLPLINVTRAKILLVFFYPLNSCANPYLYAILTKQYRRDLFILLARHGFCTKRAMRYKGAYSSVNNTFPHNTVVNAPNHRNSTLTQITLCDLTRTARASQQSNNGSLLGTMVGGSQDSLQRSVSPSRTPTKPETCCAETERLSTVQEMSHSTHSDDESSDHAHANNDGEDDDGPSGIVKQAGSPHPIKNCYTRLPFTPEQEKILKQALHESKAKKKAKGDALREHGSQIPEENEKLIKENGSVCQEMKTFGRGEAIVVCEVEVRRSGPASNINLDEIEATSTV